MKRKRNEFLAVEFENDKATVADVIAILKPLNMLLASIDMDLHGKRTCWFTIAGMRYMPDDSEPPE